MLIGTIFFFLFLNVVYTVFLIQLQKHLPTIDELNEMVQARESLKQHEFAFQVMFSLPLPPWFLKGVVIQDDSQRRFLLQHSVAMLEQCCAYSKQCCNAVLRLKSSLRTVSCNITLSSLIFRVAAPQFYHVDLYSVSLLQKQSASGCTC